MTLRVVAYTGGVSVPSARYRVRQYIPSLHTEGINVKEHYLPWGKTRPSSLSLQPFWLIGTCAARAISLPASYSCDVTLLQRHMLPAFIPMEVLTACPRVLDVDDAIWLNRGGHRMKSIARQCRAIICGNKFLAEHFQQWNDRVYIIPTAVNTNLIKPIPHEDTHNCVVGWIGSGENLEYVYQIESALQSVMQSRLQSRLLIVSDRKPEFKSLPVDRVQFMPWSPEAELKAFTEMTIGIMPLPDSEWARGKCSFKMLCYMAAGLPVVVSPVGMNNEVLALGPLGFGARGIDEWIYSLEALVDNPNLVQSMGDCGRIAVTRHYSIEQIAPRIAHVLYQAIS